jgi:hypothetical protein
MSAAIAACSVRAPAAVAPKAGARRAQRAAAKPAVRLNQVAKEATFSDSVAQRLQSVKVSLAGHGMCGGTSIGRVATTHCAVLPLPGMRQGQMARDMR